MFGSDWFDIASCQLCDRDMDGQRLSERGGAGALVSRSAGAAEDAERSADREAWPAAIATKPGEEAPVWGRAPCRHAQ